MKNNETIRHQKVIVAYKSIMRNDDLAKIRDQIVDELNRYGVSVICAGPSVTVVDDDRVVCEVVKENDEE